MFQLKIVDLNNTNSNLYIIYIKIQTTRRKRTIYYIYDAINSILMKI
jgi:hypothetical protein